MASDFTMRLYLPDHASTDLLAEALVQAQPQPTIDSPIVVYLQGDLGAGKSTLARAWLRALGVTGTVRSPTYTLVERYRLADQGIPYEAEALHLDLYRIGNAQELEFLGLDDVAAAIWLIEWPERGNAATLPAPLLSVSLEVQGLGRRCELSSSLPAGVAWLTSSSVTDSLRRFAEP